ncbi:MAG: ferredoxin family protein [Peptococcaceae bacterium]
MIDLISNIDKNKCRGCGLCVANCPLDTIRLDTDQKAYIAYPDDCMTCFVCERICPAGAINVHPFKEELPTVFPDINFDGGK